MINKLLTDISNLPRKGLIVGPLVLSLCMIHFSLMICDQYIFASSNVQKNFEVRYWSEWVNLNFKDDIELEHFNYRQRRLNGDVRLIAIFKTPDNEYLEKLDEKVQSASWKKVGNGEYQKKLQTMLLTLRIVPKTKGYELTMEGK